MAIISRIIKKNEKTHDEITHKNQIYRAGSFLRILQLLRPLRDSQHFISSDLHQNVRRSTQLARVLRKINSYTKLLEQMPRHQNSEQTRCMEVAKLICLGRTNQEFVREDTAKVENAF
jgi:DNA-binding NarL/FixJ family response regulator